MGDAKMTQEEMEQVIAKIEHSADDIEVPESLEPEAVKRKLRSGRKRFSLRRMTELAAAVALVVAVGGTGVYGMKTKYSESGAGGQESVEQSIKGAETALDASAADIDQPLPKTQVVGDYRLAESYDDVYAVMESQLAENERGIEDVLDGAVSGAIIKNELMNGMDTGADTAAGGAEISESGADTTTGGAGMEEDMAVAEGTADDVQKESSSAEKDFSGTNTQVEGVDESDFIKNDGDYLYVQTEYKVSVVDIRGKKMKQIAAFAPEMGASDTIMDMYVDGDRLYVIVQKRDTTMEDSKISAETEDLAVSSVPAYYFNSDTKMELQTYDLTDRSKIKLLGKVEQDGSYYDSRKVGDYIYLFSRKDLYAYELRDTIKAGADDSALGLIPEVNGAKVSADCIYVQDNVSNEMIVSSVCVTEPDRTVDQMVLMNRYAQIYMSTEAIYLYTGDYEWNGWENKSYTDIAKFSYKNGKMNGVGAANVRGEIWDVFAISESGGILRVLTTDWSGSASENQLYLMDKNLKVLGSLTDIATGEEIYAARYIGDIAYFITYHNTDPLFAVDISDPANPKMLGQVEITGFSDYLHPYGDGLLLGIGYETDPETTERFGVKLVMFDISNPVKLKILDSVVFDGSYCSAASDYKSALVSSSKNLIGFEVTDWSEAQSDNMSYKLYSWDGSKFVKQLSKKIDSTECWDESKIRGLYAKDRFYLVNQKEGGYQIRSYDMSDDYQELNELVVR